MSWADLANGILETCGGLFILLSVRKLLHDRMVRGVSWVHVTFFAVWGLWNLYYYPSLGQWISFAGGVLIVSANVVWVVLLLHYTVRERWGQPKYNFYDWGERDG